MSKKVLIILGSIFLIILLLVVSIIGVYYFYFSPKITTTPITKEVILDDKTLIKKFLPSNFNISFSEVSVESDTIFSEEELTDLFILSINEVQELKDIVTGLKVDINDNTIDFYIHYKIKDIPLESKLTFTCRAENGTAIFHYEKGNVGFLDIPREVLFSKPIDSSIIDLNSANGDIILAFKEIKQLDIKEATTIPNGIKLVFRGTIRFWDWLTN
ncbi:hypothetical protein [Clostridium sp.]|uniref:hypothetical protein n=1 Tax=Clostridium sp. TaxID=1506 RepID=UPI003F400E9F